MKKQILLVLGLIMMFSLVGCGNKLKKVEENTVYLKKDGTVSSCVTGEFDENTYSLDELKKMNEEDMAKVEAKFGKDSVKLVSGPTVKNGHLRLIMDYKTPEAYNLVDTLNLEISSLDKGSADGTLIEAEGGKEVTLDAISNKAEYQIAKIDLVRDDLATQIMVDGTIVYYSKGAELVNKNLVKFGAMGSNYVIYKIK